MKDLGLLYINGAYLTFAVAVLMYSLRARTWRAGGWLTAYAITWGITQAYWFALYVLRAAEAIEPETFIEHIQGVSPVSSAVSSAGCACLLLFVGANCAPAHRPWRFKELLFSFRGRIPRHQYLAVSIAIGAVGWLICGTWIDALDFHGHTGTFSFEPNSQGQKVGLAVYGVWTLLTLWPGLAATIKRWHDRGKSGWMLLVALIPIAGPIWALVETCMLRGTVGRNSFGSDPLDEDAVGG
jgi:uncharacterized membrane protein YhaH (DUF805 family)